MDCGKYLDTSLVDIDVQPRLVRLLIKGKLLQLKLEAEVSSDRATAQRSKTTGSLLVTMPLSDPSRAVLAMQGKTGSIFDKLDGSQPGWTVQLSTAPSKSTAIRSGFAAGPGRHASH